MSLKEIIIVKRKEKNISQEELAEKIGVARQTISKWETGETLPDIESLKKLAQELNFSVDKLFDLETEEEDVYSEKIIIGFFIIGVGLSLIFDNFLISTALCFIGFGFLILSLIL